MRNGCSPSGVMTVRQLFTRSRSRCLIGVWRPFTNSHSSIAQRSGASNPTQETLKEEIRRNRRIV